jgi:AraC-like DNA-binding protein
MVTTIAYTMQPASTHRAAGACHPNPAQAATARQDAVAGLLDGPRARNAFVLRSIMDPPWSLLIRDRAPLTVLSLVRGQAWVTPEDGEATLPRGGDVAIIRGPDPYTVADDPATAPQAIIHPGQRCATVDGEDIAERMSLGVRTWGNSAGGSTVMLTGTYQLDGEVSQRLLRALPAVLVVRDQEWDCPVVPLLAAEIVKDEPGQEAVLDRLLDLLLISMLRAWFARLAAKAPGWVPGLQRPGGRTGAGLLHHNPAHPWTVAALAREYGASRATLARRFSELVGEPPMAFLTSWRITLAADLLREPGASLGSVGRRVGYRSPFALSAAFKRIRGISPQQYRVRAAA